MVKGKISVRLGEELLQKLTRWRGHGLTLSDVVRLALTLLPESPDQLQKPDSPLIKVKPPRERGLMFQHHDEKEALKALQEW